MFDQRNKILRRSLQSLCRNFFKTRAHLHQILLNNLPHDTKPEFTALFSVSGVSVPTVCSDDFRPFGREPTLMSRLTVSLQWKLCLGQSLTEPGHYKE